MSKIEFNDANKAKIVAVAEFLQGTSKSLEDGLESEFGEGADVTDFDIELLRTLDDITMQCECCNWWCETSELDDDQVCDDCR